MSSSSQAVRLLVLLVVLSAGTGLTPVAAREINDQRWQAAECPFKVAKDFTAGEDVICGTITVPQRHADPAGPTIRLTVAIFKAFGESRAPDPLVLFTGGPGANIFDLAPKDRSGTGGSIMNQRDIVLMSERGTFGAEPFLDCPELSALDKHFGVWGRERDALELEAYIQCKDRLVDEGIDLASYTNTERAADVPFVMDVLGYDRYNLWGVSGGGMLTELVARDHPASGVRTIMTDSGAFPRADFRDVFTPLFTNVSTRYRLLFSSCAADPACNASYPNLEKTFFDLVADLNAHPVHVSIKNPATKQKVPIELTDDLFIAVLTNSFGMIGLVPKMICDTAEGDYDLLSVFLPGAFGGDTGIGTADGLYLSMVCPEIGGMIMDDIATEDAHPEIVRAMAPKVQLFFDLCSVWNVPQVPPGAVVRSDVPALIMEGAFDTNQPPEYGAEVATNFSTAHVVEFGDKAHVTLSECGLAMMDQFLNDPTRRPDTGCVATSPVFSSPAGPLWWIVYNNLPWFIAGAVLVLLLITAGTVWLVRRKRAAIRLAVAGR